MQTVRLRSGGGTCSATLRVDGRTCSARPLRGSGLGEVSGLAVVAETDSDVVQAAAWMPGRILVLCGEAITRTSVPVVANSARLATFTAIVIVTDDLIDLGRMGEDSLPIPVVVVAREADQSWIRRATRVTAGVHRDGGAEVAVHTHPRDRVRHFPPPHAIPGTVEP